MTDRGFFPKTEERQGKTIGIIGSRQRNSHHDAALCGEAFREIYEPGDRIVSGGCPKGGDAFAESIAKKLGITITIHYPDWSSGRGAGMVRNTLIANDCDVLIALVSEDRRGGTEDTIAKAMELGKRITLL